ncbi:MAG: extracellular solute-binding protein [Lachnospiraceae bacterium]|nr:extracellular solute-binding protein [Lachnospiraceae bacterium]
MKRYRLKAVSLLLAAGLIASLIGCGKGNGETGKGTAKEADMAMSGQENASETTQEGAQKRIPKELAGNYYTGEYETLLETATVDKPAVSDRAVYYARWYPSGTKVFKYDMETKQTTEIPLNLGEREGIQGLCINEDGELVAVKSYFEEADEGKIYYWILVFSEDGTVLWEKEVTELVQEETEIIDFPNAYVYGLALGKEGRICFCAMRTIWVLDREGNLEFSIRSDEHIYNMGTLPDGNIAISKYVYMGSEVSILELEKQEWKDTYASSHFDESLSFAESGDGEIYFYTTKELFSFDLESKHATVAADWIENDILGDDVCYVSVLPNGDLRMVTSDAARSGGGTEMALLKQADIKERAQKEIITMGTIELTGGMRSAVTSFNRHNDKYRVEVIEYSQGTTYNEGVKFFNAEAVAGNMPDVMNITDGTEEFYAAKGVFEDLKPYLDGENGIDRSEYFNNILTAMETNGKLYALSPDFTIKTLVGRKSVVGAGEGYGWTLEDIAALEESREENVEMMDHEYGRDVLWQLLYYNMAQFFDLDAGVCDFDNDDFKGVLEFAGRFPISNPYHDDDPSPLLLANEGELLLLPMELDEIRIYQAYCQIFNADISCVGYPGNYACGSVAKGGDMTIVMSEKSQNKEGAWEFIRSFLEKDYQHRYTTCLPMLRSAYDRKAAEAMWIDYETGEKQTSGSSIGFGGPEFNTVVYDVTEGVTEEVKKLIEKIGRMERVDIQILNIVFEEAGAYFAGQKSVDEVASVIQSRANIYMNENR